MSTFGQALAAQTLSGGPMPAPRTTKLEPSDFASDWQNRPVAPVEIGLRLPSEDDVQTARIQADKRVDALDLKDIESSIAAYNDALMACAVARSMCDPRDVQAESPILPLAEDTITLALTSRAITRIYDEIERLMVEQSPLAPEATDEELADFAVRLQAQEFAVLGSVDSKAFRRFAKYCLEFLPEKTSVRAF